MISLHDELKSAMKSVSPTETLKASLKERLADGARREDLIKGLEALRSDPSSPEEDVILEVLDYLTGWCRAEQRLY